MNFMNKINNLILLLVFGLFFTPLISFAQETGNIPTFVPLVGIPGVDADAEFGTYINALYTLSISLAALLAVIKIVIAGVKWMLTDIVTSKENAKKDIQGALVGLLIIISAVVVLNFVNPKLTSTEIFLEEVTGNPIQGGSIPEPILRDEPVRCSRPARCTSECYKKGGKPDGEPVDVTPPTEVGKVYKLSCMVEV